MIQTYIPTGLDVMLSRLSFWLHVEAVAARVALGILTILTMTAQRGMTNPSLAQVSYVKAIDIWMAVCLCSLFCALLEYACVYVMSRKKPKKIYQETLENKAHESLVSMKLHGLLMLPGKAKFVSCSIIGLGLSF